MFNILRSVRCLSKTTPLWRPSGWNVIQPSSVRPSLVAFRFVSSDLGRNLRDPQWDRLQLSPIKKDLYQEHTSVTSLTSEEVAAYREQYQIEVKGGDPPNPITKFEDGLFPPELMEVIRKKEFLQPTSIQAQTWPVVMQGRDLVGIAQTGTGKTMAYMLPAILHIINQAPLQPRDGPIALVVAPTRELVQQIHQVAQEFTRTHRLRSVCLYGGASRAPQITGLNRGAHLVIATPGRLIDLLDTGITNLHRCSYLVLDEADRMLDMGFEPQVRAIMGQTRKDRQTLMWSATWPSEIRQLAEDFLSPDTVQVNIGSTDCLRANHNISQNVEVCEEHEKREILLKLVERHSSDKMLIFTQTKKKVDWLVRLLQNNRYKAAGIHGDRSQNQRDYIIKSFKGGDTKILVATDVASRGLDVKDIEVVINFDFPNVAEDYIHRIGRTGRVDKQGEAYTLFTPENQGLAADLVRIIEEAGQTAPEDLKTLANNASHKSVKSQGFRGRPRDNDHYFTRDSNRSYNNRGYNNRSYNNRGYNNRDHNNRSYDNNRGYNNSSYKQRRSNEFAVSEDRIYREF